MPDMPLRESHLPLEGGKATPKLSHSTPTDIIWAQMGNSPTTVTLAPHKPQARYNLQAILPLLMRGPPIQPCLPSRLLRLTVANQVPRAQCILTKVSNHSLAPYRADIPLVRWLLPAFTQLRTLVKRPGLILLPRAMLTRMPQHPASHPQMAITLMPLDPIARLQSLHFSRRKSRRRVLRAISMLLQATALQRTHKTTVVQHPMLLVSLWAPQRQAHLTLPRMAIRRVWRTRTTRAC